MELREGLTIGPYQLVERAGTGGMAEVWRAYHPRLDRCVAIKVISPRHAIDPDYQQRFLREARMSSRLDHPHILMVHEYGEQDGLPYMVSPFVGGGTLAARLGRGAWTVDEAIAILEPLASALDYAHSRAIVHRDVKPSNVLFTDDGRLLLGDFGIARLLDDTATVTVDGVLIGTPTYMSPEQADGEGVGPASDLYSLGVVAYRLLTGRTPFADVKTPLAVLQAHAKRPLPPPRSLNPTLPEAIETALYKLLAKKPIDRFPSGADFVAALRTSSARLACLETTAVAVQSVGSPQESCPSMVGGATRIDSGRALTVDTSATSPAAASDHDVPVANASPRPTVPVPPDGSTDRRPRGSRRPSRRGFLMGLGAALATGAGFDVTGSRIVASVPLQSWSATGATARTLVGHSWWVSRLAFAPGGQILASGSMDGTVRLWRVANGSLMRTLNDHIPSVDCLAFSPDGTTLATGAESFVRLWSVDDGSLLRTFELDRGWPSSVAFSPNGQHLAIAASVPKGSTTVQIWRVADGGLVHTLTGHVAERRVSTLVFSGDGQTLTSTSGGTLREWRVADGSTVRATGTLDNADYAALSPDRQLWATTAGPGKTAIQLGRFADNGPARTLYGHTNEVWSVTFSADGQLLASGSRDKTVRLWRVADGSLLGTFDNNPSSVVDQLADRLRLIQRTSPSAEILWRTIATVALSPNSQLVAAGSYEGDVHLWRVARSEER